MSIQETVEGVITHVGGKSNINNAWHCMTRLRFDLKDNSKVDVDKLESVPNVMGVKLQNGQYQVVIGTDVNDYYVVLAKELGLNEYAAAVDDPNAAKEDMGEKNGGRNWVTLFMDTVSGVFGPIVPAIAGAGMIKGLMAGLVAIKVISNTTPTHQVIDMLASGVFTFLPFFVAASAAKIFRTNEYLAVAIAAAMQYPTMTAAAAAKEFSAYQLFGFIPVPVFNYAGTIIPIIFSTLALSYIWRAVDRVLPKATRTVFTPMFSLFITSILALTVIGPIGIYLGNALADGVRALFAFSPIVAGLIVGGTRPLLVFLGLHHAMTPIALQNFANQGWDNLMPTMFMANIAITGACAALYFKVKDANKKTLIVSAVVSGFLGITEPALFGFLSKYRKAFIASCVGAGLASVFFSIVGVKIYGYILSSVFSLTAYVGPYLIPCLIGIAISFGTAFGITYALVPQESDLQAA